MPVIQTEIVVWSWKDECILVGDRTEKIPNTSCNVHQNSNCVSAVCAIFLPLFQCNLIFKTTLIRARIEF